MGAIIHLTYIALLQSSFDILYCFAKWCLLVKLGQCLFLTFGVTFSNKESSIEVLEALFEAWNS